ncbi:MAG: metallophosphoesterase [Halioglobus sp.]|nr:metallophosphoesterase [Halioglobus sp.]
MNDTLAGAQHFAQISDPHLSTLEGVRATQLLNKRALGYLSWRRKRRFEHRREVLDALARDLNVAALEQLLVTGDLTHIGLPSEFRQGKEWLERLGEPRQVALVPGNHDACVAAPFEDTFALWQDYMASDTHAAANFPSLRERGDIAFIGLCTACPKPPLMATGTAGAEQLARLPALLDAARGKGQFRVVYLHHCPLPGEEKWRKRLTDAAQVSAILAAHGAELVLHGHGHRAHRHTLATRDGEATVIAVPSASALGLHGADVASYNRYAVTRSTKGWQLRISARRYDRGLGVFVAGETREVALARA